MNQDNATQIRHAAEGLFRALGNYTSIREHNYSIPHTQLFRWREALRHIQHLSVVKRERKRKVQLLFNKHALWVGVHHSNYNRRTCINILPGVTICITQAGGIAP